MPKLVIGRNGVVVNVIVAPSADLGDIVWSVPDAQVVNAGDVLDPHDPQIDAMDVAVFRALFRHENLIRQLIRAVRTNAGINTAANTAGLPTAANSADLTLTQARDAFKALLP